MGIRNPKSEDRHSKRGVAAKGRKEHKDLISGVRFATVSQRSMRLAGRIQDDAHASDAVEKLLKQLNLVMIARTPR